VADLFEEKAMRKCRAKQQAADTAAEVTQMTSKEHAMHTCAHDKTSRPLRPFGASGICWMPNGGVPVWLQQPGGPMKAEGRWESTHSHGVGRGDLIPRLFSAVRIRLPAVGRRMSTPQLVRVFCSAGWLGDPIAKTAVILQWSRCIRPHLSDVPNHGVSSELDPDMG
jgi:hypothetical protein